MTDWTRDLAEAARVRALNLRIETVSLIPRISRWDLAILASELDEPFTVEVEARLGLVPHG